NYLDALCAVEAVAFDKTGTLTRGVFSVTGVFPSGGFTREALLDLSADAESLSTHPIAKSVAAAGSAGRGTADISDYREVAGRGVSVSVNGTAILAGNAKLLAENGIEVPEVETTGAAVYVAADGVFAGYITVEDTPRGDAQRAVSTLNSRNIRTIMLTGDNKKAAETVAEALGITEYHAELMPAGKVEALDTLMAGISSGGKVCFLGDGINDAPVLARADIGIAMGGLGSDAAIEAADIVLMTDEPSRLYAAIDIAKYTRKIVTQNIAGSLGVKFAIMALGIFGLAGMWAAVFADVGVAFLAVLNSARVIRKFR
ncbi:MAG: HAD-IC family P-type ATPase, partial [Oscillospiraceae bacterium]|nr:HAD-IC family P-type ATPase [Oscillospiraceae bacterium]